MVQVDLIKRGVQQVATKGYDHEVPTPMIRLGCWLSGPSPFAAQNASIVARRATGAMNRRSDSLRLVQERATKGALGDSKARQTYALGEESLHRVADTTLKTPALP